MPPVLGVGVYASAVARDDAEASATIVENGIYQGVSAFYGKANVVNDGTLDVSAKAVAVFLADDTESGDAEAVARSAMASIRALRLIRAVRR